MGVLEALIAERERGREALLGATQSILNVMDKKNTEDFEQELMSMSKGKELTMDEMKEVAQKYNRPLQDVFQRATTINNIKAADEVKTLGRSFMSYIKSRREADPAYELDANEIQKFVGMHYGDKEPNMMAVQKTLQAMSESGVMRQFKKPTTDATTGRVTQEETLSGKINPLFDQTKAASSKLETFVNPNNPNESVVIDLKVEAPPAGWLKSSKAAELEATTKENKRKEGVRADEAKKRRQFREQQSRDAAARGMEGQARGFEAGQDIMSPSFEPQAQAAATEARKEANKIRSGKTNANIIKTGKDQNGVTVYLYDDGTMFDESGNQVEEE